MLQSYALQKLWRTSFSDLDHNTDVQVDAPVATEESVAAALLACKDGYWTCLDNCPILLPNCGLWPASCAIIYCT
ncbi:hypothetical protein BS50DRAFT_568061 [Corynespora cassiicola Philippines]|uniref:Uncharacterized protein n=1 Tax=Corynespora cassiicola Philippines TaxID=1448308 RepID=A0A2T2PCJ8_CORCC|nr:hypothetical protein BS50DRAFT_568061 [Corynespora cassiicola Philippines]